MSKRIIKKLIGRGYLGEAIDLMLELVEKYGNASDVENILYNISGQYHNNESGRRSSTITADAYNTTRNRINGNLGDILDDNFKEIPESAIPENYKGLIKSPEPKTTVHEAPPSEEELDNDQEQEEENEPEKKILVLSSNPVSTVKIDISLERARIAEKLEKTDFNVVSEKNVTSSRFAELILEEKPMIVHFSGHGEASSSSSTEEEYVDVVRGVGKEKEQSGKEKQKKKKQAGIILLDDDGRKAHFVKANRLRRTFDTLINLERINIKAVILNACYSEEQAKAISEVGVSVIGTSSEIQDRAAIAFSSGFYYAIGKGKSIENALNWAINVVLDIDDSEDRFILYKDGQKVPLKA